jgi:hypothetical protein
MGAPLATRFMAKVKVMPGDLCWEWQGGVSRRGYGQFAMKRPDGKQNVMNAMRAAWLLFRGPIGPGLDVCHKCDNKLCVRLDHLFLGTRVENHRDCVNKGRWPTAKMTPQKVRELRRRREAGERVKDIAASEGIPVSRVQNVVSRRTWVTA